MAKALVVDDEQNLRKVLAAMLRREGYDVAVAENGVQALAELRKNSSCSRRCSPRCPRCR